MKIKEFTWALGLEYLLGDNFAVRTGYFNESEEKGSRRYLTFGSGFTLTAANEVRFTPDRRIKD